MTRSLHIVKRPKGHSIARLRQAVRLYSSEYASRATNRHNRIAWLRAVAWLGDKWVYRGGQVSWGHGNKEAA